jgi:hypothetical protein
MLSSLWSEGSVGASSKAWLAHAIYLTIMTVSQYNDFRQIFFRQRHRSIIFFTVNALLLAALTTIDIIGRVHHQYHRLSIGFSTSLKNTPSFTPLG